MLFLLLISQVDSLYTDNYTHFQILRTEDSEIESFI